MIKFEEINEVEFPQFKGGNGITKNRMFADENVKIMRVVLEKGSSIGIHTHTTNSEIIYIIDGIARCSIDGKEEIVKKGECHYCPKGSTHSILNENEKDLVMFCVVPEQ